MILNWPPVAIAGTIIRKAINKKIISQARNSKEKMREEVKNELEEKVVSFACDLVKGAFDEKIYKNAHSELIDNIINYSIMSNNWR